MQLSINVCQDDYAFALLDLKAAIKVSWDNVIGIYIDGFYRVFKDCNTTFYRLLDSLVVECWLWMREVPGSIPSQGPPPR